MTILLTCGFLNNIYPIYLHLSMVKWFSSGNSGNTGLKWNISVNQLIHILLYPLGQKSMCVVTVCTVNDKLGVKQKEQRKKKGKDKETEGKLWKTSYLFWWARWRCLPSFFHCSLGSSKGTLGWLIFRLWWCLWREMWQCRSSANTQACKCYLKS